MYEEVPNDPSALLNTIIKAVEKIGVQGDLSSDTLNYFVVEDPKLARFPKFINVYTMYLVDQSFQIAAFTLRTYLRF